MKQFLFLLTILAAIAGCKQNENSVLEKPRKETMSQLFLNTNGEFQTPESFAFTSFNADYKDKVYNAIADSLKMVSLKVVTQDSSLIENVSKLQLSENAFVKLYNRFHFNREGFIDAIVDSLEFYKSNPSGTIETLAEIKTKDYNTLHNHIKNSRRNLFGLIQRISPPHVPVCKYSSCPTHKQSEKQMIDAKAIGSKILNINGRTLHNTFLDIRLPENMNQDVLQNELKELFRDNLQTNKAQVKGNLNDTFILSVSDWKDKPKSACGVSFKIITTISDGIIQSFIVNTKHNDDSNFCSSDFEIIEYYKEYLRANIISTILKASNQSTAKIEMPTNLDKYSSAMGSYITSGGINPLNKVNYTTKEYKIPPGKNKSKCIVEYVAKQIWPYSEPIQITEFKIVDTTAYVQFNIHKDGFMGVSVWLGKIEPLVRRNLIRNIEGIEEVKFESLLIEEGELNTIKGQYSLQ